MKYNKNNHLTYKSVPKNYDFVPKNSPFVPKNQCFVPTQKIGILGCAYILCLLCLFVKSSIGTETEM